MRVKPQENSESNLVWVIIGAGTLLSLTVIWESHKVAALRKENVDLKQQITAVEPLNARNLELAGENQRLLNSQRANFDEILSLRSALESERDATNSLLIDPTARVVLERTRQLEEENLRLRADLTGKPRVPRVGAWLGVSVSDGQGGVQVGSVVENGPAARSGLQEGDVLQAVNGQLLYLADDLKTIMAQKSGGQRIALDVIRGATSVQIEVTPSDWPQ